MTIYRQRFSESAEKGQQIQCKSWLDMMMVRDWGDARIG